MLRESHNLSRGRMKSKQGLKMIDILESWAVLQESTSLKLDSKVLSQLQAFFHGAMVV